jgi:CRP-like cAMP-binding protein
MSATVSKTYPIRNGILAALPCEEFARLLPNLKPVNLTAGEVLYDTGDNIRYAYFLNSGAVCLVAESSNGESIEVGSVGNEGVVGVPTILRVERMLFRAVVEIPGDALRVEAEMLREEFHRGGKLQNWLLRYTHALFTQISQSGICNHFHTVEQRLSRWLLVTSDRGQSESFQLTHELIAQMMGTSRSAVTMAAVKLQRLGLISLCRGKVSILDRSALQMTGCECYEIIKDEFDRFLDS